jgi:hypothetical protein
MDSNGGKFNAIIPSEFVNKMNSTASLLNRNRFFAIMPSSVLVVILIGLILTIAKLIFFSSTAALFAGVLLWLLRPAWIMWAVLSMGLLVVSIVPLTRLTTAVWDTDVFGCCLFAAIQVALLFALHLLCNAAALLESVPFYVVFAAVWGHPTWLYIHMTSMAGVFL